MIDWLAAQLDEGQRRLFSDVALELAGRAPAHVAVGSLYGLLMAAVLLAFGAGYLIALELVEPA